MSGTHENKSNQVNSTLSMGAAPNINISQPSLEAEMRTLIIGVGETGCMTIDRMKSGESSMPGNPVVAVDDDPEKLGKIFAGIKVEGTCEDIPRVVEEFGVSQIVFAIPSATREQRTRIYDICLKTEVRVLAVPSSLLGTPVKTVEKVPIKQVGATELLSRPEIMLDTDEAVEIIKGKTVLVTGGGGSIGSEICRQIATMEPGKVIIFDIYENTAYELYRELLNEYGSIAKERFVVEIGSIRDSERLWEVFDAYSPQVIFHAAAHKHVPLMEHNPREAVLNNVFGTLNVAKLAVEWDVERFVLISTDKAVNPTNVMGATKRMCEMIMQRYAKVSPTVFTAVRFGNVLGSHGSVIPLFKAQIANGGPVTVTHKDVTRYFMTIPEASCLVIQAAALAKGGEIFVLDMGEPVRIYNLAEKLIRLSGFEPGRDIEIEVTGLRPGEKLYEELLMDDEGVIPTEHKDITISTAKAPTPEEVDEKIKKLAKAVHESSSVIKDCLMNVVTTYKPSSVL